MPEIYIAWIPGLIYDLKALRYLKDSGMIHGIEMTRTHSGIKNLKALGLKLSLHNPGLYDLPNLADPNLLTLFEGEAGEQLLVKIQRSEAPVVGYHCGFSAEKIYKMKAHPDVPDPETMITDREALLNRLSTNLIHLDRKINQSVEPAKQKHLLLETMDYSREQPIDWAIQDEIPVAERRKIEAIFEKYGINAAYQHVMELSFIQTLLDNVTSASFISPGFLFDMAHVVITADAMIHENQFTGTIDDYVDEIISTLGARTFQLHLNVPDGNTQTGFIDAHEYFQPGEKLSDWLLDMVRRVSAQCPNLLLITLEMGRPVRIPHEYVKTMVRQAELVVGCLK